MFCIIAIIYKLLHLSVAANLHICSQNHEYTVYDLQNVSDSAEHNICNRNSMMIWKKHIFILKLNIKMRCLMFLQVIFIHVQCFVFQLHSLFIRQPHGQQENNFICFHNDRFCWSVRSWQQTVHLCTGMCMPHI